MIRAMSNVFGLQNSFIKSDIVSGGHRGILSRIFICLIIN